MGSRAGVGATLAAAVLFSSLLVSNALVVSGSQQQLALTEQSNAESYLAAGASALAVSAGLSLLDSLESHLAATLLSCGNASSAVEAFLDGLSTVVGYDHVSARGSFAEGQNESLAGNMVSLAPYSGWQAGDLDINFSVVVRGGVPGLGVTYSSNQSHPVYLPVDLGRLEAFCSDSLEADESALLGSGGSLCNATEAGNVLTAQTAAEAALGQLMGLGLNATWTVSQPGQCQVKVTVEVFQSGTDGPAGPFTVSAEEAATVQSPAERPNGSS